MKRNPNEPDNKARERLNEFNRQRQAVPAENEGTPINAGKAKINKDAGTPEKDKPGAATNKKNIKKSPKK